MYYNPVEVIKTNNWKEECNNLQQKLGIQNPLVITSKGNIKRNNLSSVFNSELVYSNINRDPTFESCQSAIDFSAVIKFDGVISMGGGSVMDTAKAVMASKVTGVYDITKLLKISDPYEKNIPSIFMPTTHGTGSEVTMWGTIWNSIEKKKYSISDPSLYPSVALLDASLTLSLPLNFSIITSLDALSHSFESLWNKNANITSTKYAIEAIILIISNIELLKDKPLDLSIRTKLLNASNKAGLAFSNTKTAVAHSISYPLTINYNIPHGIASSITLPALIELNRETIHDSLIKICGSLNISIDELIRIIQSISNNIIPFNLKDWGVPSNDLEGLARSSFTKERMNNSLLKLNYSDVLEILKSIY
jgi:alcohol dehydrogenase class IV